MQKIPCAREVHGKNGLLCTHLLIKHIRSHSRVNPTIYEVAWKLVTKWLENPCMFPYFPIRFLIFHQLFPQSLWVFPVFSLVFLSVFCFRSYKNINHCERSKDGKNSKKTKQTTANSVRTITMIFLKRVSTIQLFNL